jgi:hypothetical protein
VRLSKKDVLQNKRERGGEGEGERERMPSLPLALACVLLIPLSRLTGNRGIPRRGCARVSRAETQSLPASAPIRAPRR